MNFKYLFGSILSFPFLPFLYLDGKRIKKEAPELPEAKGTNGLFQHGVNAPQFELLLLGESSVAGVGVDNHSEGFTGKLSECISKNYQQNVHWSVYARNGYTINRVRHKIIPKITEKAFNLIVIGLGGNDAFALRSPQKFEKNINSLIKDTQQKFPDTPIVFINMPPIRDFPAFTRKIKFSIGGLIDLYRSSLMKVVKQFDMVWFNDDPIQFEPWQKKLDSNLTINDFFSDGVHPSKLTYQIWAEIMFDYIQKEGVLHSYQ